MCEHHVVIDAAMHRFMLEHMAHDRRKDGNKGRCLTANVPSLGLLAGDRLEASMYTPDPNAFEDITRFPHPIVFWRCGEETLSRHRNPFFVAELGLAPARALSVDSLHTVFLGVMQNLCRKTAWWLIAEAHAWGRYGNIDDTYATAVLVIRAELKVFYRKYDRANPLKKLTRVHGFSRRTLGTPSERTCRTKAAQTWGFLLFLIDRMEAFLHFLPAEAGKYLAAAKAMRSLVQTWNCAGTNLTVEQKQAAFDNWQRFLNITDDWEDLFTPKRHLTTHLVARTAFHGNPRRYAVWQDEALNRDLKLACRTVSQKTFEPFLLQRMRAILNRKGSKRRRIAIGV